MKLPRKGVLIRLAIYLPVIAFLAYNAFFSGGGDEDQVEVPSEEAKTPGKKRKMKLPDGTEVEYLELTPEEAKQLGYDPQPPPE